MDGNFTRREFLTTAGRVAALGGLAGLGLAGSRPAAASAQAQVDPPLVWVWKFSADGELTQVRDTLAANGLGIILKTHDGDEWMTRFDKSPEAITGPAQVARLANVFERAGVPFHTWCVVQGNDPIAEARMCAAVLDAGARSIYLDLEPTDGRNYWQGPWDAALRFGEELRRLQPSAWLSVAPDARPWQVAAVPLQEFMSFSDSVAPQSYWATFDGPANYRRLAEHGYEVGPEGVTPELIVEVGHGTFRHFGLPIQPIGQGASTPEMWQRFLASTTAGNMNPVSLWRYGSADPAVFGVLGEAVRQAKAQLAAQQAPPPTQTPAEPSGPAAAAAEAPAAPPSALAEAVQAEPAISASQVKASPFDEFRSRRRDRSWRNRAVGSESRFPSLQRRFAR